MADLVKKRGANFRAEDSRVALGKLSPSEQVQACALESTPPPAPGVARLSSGRGGSLALAGPLRACAAPARERQRSAEAWHPRNQGRRPGELAGAAGSLLLL